ncbi:MAG: hypothetical protein CL897_04885 [Dehalococcoidia bacterium]|nr:hypothetical protein [Dehalococcoidia bacterium]|tara:strand:- start:629 stop:1606 length:978 start_codon:yes stop_codon:yes gene_type:complete
MENVSSIVLGDNTVHFVTRGNVCILIDTGPDFAGAWELLQEKVEEQRPDFVVATHGHHDHAGLGKKWQSIGVPVWVGRNDGPMTAAPQLQSPDEMEALLAWAEDTGAPIEITAHFQDRLERRRETALRAATSKDYPKDGIRWPTGLRYPPFEADSLIEGNIEVDGIQILSAPGHTPGNMVLAIPEEGWLFSGDQLLPNVDPLPAIQFLEKDKGLQRFPSLAYFTSSLERLAEIGFTRCFPGHGKPFDQAAEAITEALGRIERRCTRVHDSLRKEGPASVYELGIRLYPRGTKHRFWQTASSIQGQLDLLEAREEAQEVDGQWMVR